MNTTETYYNQAIFAEYLIIKGYSIKSQETMHKYLMYFANWCNEENIELTEIGYNDVVAYVQFCKKRGLAQNTIQAQIGSISHFYKCLIGRDEIADNPCSNVDIKGGKRRKLYQTFSLQELQEIHSIYAAQTNINPLIHTRNKIMLSLFVYQGLRSEELARLKVVDVKMREGKIFVAGGRRSNEREMVLDAHQIYELINYINETRKQLLAITGKTTDALFVSIGNGKHFSNILVTLTEALQKCCPKVRDVKQLRGSVITNWLKIHNLRKVQYMAGHRYVSSTEAYQANNMDSLIEDVNSYHPNL